jgi:hypothetical protein
VTTAAAAGTTIEMTIVAIVIGGILSLIFNSLQLWRCSLSCQYWTWKALVKFQNDSSCSVRIFLKAGLRPVGRHTLGSHIMSFSLGGPVRRQRFDLALSRSTLRVPPISQENQILRLLSGLQKILSNR